MSARVVGEWWLVTSHSPVVTCHYPQLCGLCGSPTDDGMVHLECSQREQAREDWASDARQQEYADNFEAAGGDLWIAAIEGAT